MLRPLIQRPRRSSTHRTRERGVTMALVALAMVGIIAMAALSIDVGTLYQASAEAQRSADQAALAAARVLSLSGMTGDPANLSGQWPAACAAANQTAQTVANQNTVSGKVPSSINVTFLSTDASNCTAPGAFGVNPMVRVQVVQANLPTYFSRIWGRTGNSVSATATAEVFNPSSSASYSASGDLVPVQPRCVKPLIVPNLDPGYPTGGCDTNVGTLNRCQALVNTDGSLVNPGIRTAGGSATAVIGETFNLVPDCNSNGPTCNLTPGGGQVFAQNPGVVVPGNLQYVPGLTPAASSAVPNCATDPYQQAVAGCDQSTKYQCGMQYLSLASPNLVDLNENPGIAPTSDTATAAQCLIQQVKGNDSLLTNVYPYQIQAGAGNPLVGANGTVITNSNSIVTIPIYDGNGTTLLPINGANQAPVTIVGFLQVFINVINAGGIDGSLNVTVLNVAGCGTGVPAGTTPVYGTSPVPVRLITPPSS